MSWFNEPVILQNHMLLLRPIRVEDESMFWELTRQEDWSYYTSDLGKREGMALWMKQAMQAMQKGERYVFAIIDRQSGKALGSTSFGAISEAHQRLEIGWTWLAEEARGTGINKHMKFLMLQYAFEELACERVELKTDVLNKRSRRAMEKIGATQEGILRNHMNMQNGRRRDTVYYSILRHEWPELRHRVFEDTEWV